MRPVIPYFSVIRSSPIAPGACEEVYRDTTALPAYLGFAFNDSRDAWGSPTFDRLPDMRVHYVDVPLKVLMTGSVEDTTGFRYGFDTYFTRSSDGGAPPGLSPNVRVNTQSSNEHDCNGVYPCSASNYGNQQGDHEGLASFGGVSHPVWMDSSLQQVARSGCSTNLFMEEVFTAVGR